VQRLEAALIPAGVASGTEEVRAQVVVHAMNLPAKLAEVVTTSEPMRPEEPVTKRVGIGRKGM